MGATQELARLIVEDVDEATLTDDVVQVGREIVLDGVANMLAGSQEPLGEIVRQYAGQFSDSGPSTVAGTSIQTNPMQAAFMNGVFCHSLDFELMWYPPTHPTSPTLPAILALAEARGRSGRDVLVAIAVGFEVQGRIRHAIVESGIGPTVGIHPPGSVGPLGAAAACSKLLGLDVAATRMALGIAGSRVGGLGANIGSMTKSTHSGNAARMGVESALLAELGFTANDDILEAERGYSATYFGGMVDLDLVTADFGHPYRMVDPGLTFKKYPAQYTTHWSIDAALALKQEHGLDADGVVRVEVEVGADNEAAERPLPQTGLQGKFSIPYTVAVALLDGRVDAASFRDERLWASDMEDMLPRIVLKPNPSVSGMDFAKAWAQVTIFCQDGEEYSRRVDRPLGIWDNPASWEVRVEKFRECSSPVLDAAVQATLLVHIEEFETLDDASSATRLLRSGNSSGG